MRLRWRTPLILLLCGPLAGCLPCAALPRPADPNCTLEHLGNAHALEDGEVVLTPDEVQRNAVRNSGVGAALEADSGNDPSCLTCLPGHKRAALTRLLKAYAADEVRNQAAALALTTYYRLAETRLQIRLVQQSLNLADRLVARAGELLKQGLTPPEHITKLQRQRSEVLAELLRLELLRDRLTEQLRHLADGKIRVCRIATIEVFKVVDEPIDECQAIAIALKYRPDLNLLRATLTHLDGATLPLIRQVLAGLNPLLGGKSGCCVPLVECLVRLVPVLTRGEVEKVRQELTAILCERERQAVSEVRQALRKIRTSVQLAKEAQECERLAGQRLAELEEKSSKGLATDGDLPLARREQVKTRSDVLHEVIEWEIARMELRQAQGLLVREVLCDGPAHTKAEE